jgi:hypothetical protein
MGATNSAPDVDDDWLDDHCWRCGSADVLPDPEGVILCGSCHRAEFGPMANPGVAMAERFRWEALSRDRCWRCLARPVDPEDDLGLCESCLPD